MNSLFNELLEEETDESGQKGRPQLTWEWDMFHELEEILGVKGSRSVNNRVRKVLAALIKKAKSGELSLDLQPEPEEPGVDPVKLKTINDSLLKAARGQLSRAILQIDELMKGEEE